MIALHVPNRERRLCWMRHSPRTTAYVNSLCVMLIFPARRRNTAIQREVSVMMYLLVGSCVLFNGEEELCDDDVSGLMPFWEFYADIGSALGYSATNTLPILPDKFGI